MWVLAHNRQCNAFLPEFVHGVSCAFWLLKVLYLYLTLSNMDLYRLLSFWKFSFRVEALNPKRFWGLHGIL